MAAAAPPTTVTTTSRPENSAIMLNASSGSNIAPAPMMMAIYTGAAAAEAARRGVSETRSASWSRNLVSGAAMGLFSFSQARYLWMSFSEARGRVCATLLYALRALSILR